MRTFQESRDGKPEGPGETGHRAKRRRSAWIWAERLLLGSGLVLLAIYGTIRIEGILSSRAALERFAALESSVATTSRDGGESAGSSGEADASPEINLSNVDFSQWDAHRVQAYQRAVTAQAGAPLGVLRIPKIHLEAPLLDGTDGATLNYAVGRITGTGRPGEQGNIGIAGHRDGFFRGLKDVGVGDAIELKTIKGTDTYVVDRIQIVAPDDVSVLRRRSVPSLTLVTCYPFYFIGSAPQRYIVTASLTREIQGGSENSTLRPLSERTNPTRRNHEQDE